MPVNEPTLLTVFHVAGNFVAVSVGARALIVTVASLITVLMIPL
jgi:hypothetical protein